MNITNRFKAHTKPVYRLAFSPDAAHLLSSGGDEKIVLWSPAAGAREQEWRGSQFIAPIAYSPDGQFIGTGGYSIRVWRADDSECPIIASQEWATSCSFSHDARIFAAFGAERPLMCWEMPAGTPVAAEWGGTRASNGNTSFPVGGMTFHPQRPIVANCYGVLGTNGFDTVIHLRDTTDGALIESLAMRYHCDHPTILAFSPNGKLLTAETGPHLHVWDWEHRREAALLQVSKKHFKSFAFSPDGSTLFAVNNEAELRSWDTGTWLEKPPVDGRIGRLTALAVASTGQIAIGSGTGNIALLL